MKNKIILLAVLTLAILGIYRLYSYGYVEVLSAGDAKSVKIILTNQADDGTHVINVSGGTGKKLVRRGNYELLATQNDTSYFTVIKTGGFLGKTAVQTKFAPEKSRKFVGNNPGPCMFYNGDALLSSGCGDRYFNAQIHLPATAEQPTITKKMDAIVEGTIEGYYSDAQSNFVLIEAPEVREDQGAPHSLFILDKDLNPSGGFGLDQLSVGKSYKIIPFQQGFIAYDSTLEDIYYYTGVSSQAVKLDIKPKLSNGLGGYLISARDRAIAVAYTTKEGVEDVESEHNEYPSTIVIKEGESIKEMVFDKRYSAMQLCGKNKLCLTEKKRLEVYDVSGAKQKLLFSINGVESMYTSNGDFLVVRQNEILKMNVDSKNGYVDYSFGEYSHCGSQNVPGGYVLCMINPKNDKVAVYIEQGQNNTDSIDKKITELMKIPEVSNVSIYDRFIYISPNLGDPEYDNNLGSFNYSAEVRSKTAKTIRDKVNSLGIDQTKYKIINTLE